MRYLTAIAVVVTMFALSCAGEGTTTYRNESLGYELRYPASWSVDSHSPSAAASGAPIRQESVRLIGPDSQGAPSVFITVNQTSRWCETGMGQEVTIVFVGDRAGEQYECSLGRDFPCRPSPACREEIYQIVWSFPAEPGRPGYVVIGIPGNSVSQLREVFATLRFIEAN